MMRWQTATRTVFLIVSLAASQYASAQTSSDNHARTPSGEDLGVQNFKSISEGESAVRFTDPSDVKSREAANLRDRSKERLTLRNNTVLNYSKLILRGDSFGPHMIGKALADLPYQLNNDFVKSRGIKYDEHDAHQAGLLAYLVQSSATHTCFVFDAYLGETTFDQVVFGNICYPVRVRSVSQLEHEMLTLLSHARFPKTMDSGNFSVSLEIPETMLAAPASPQPIPTQIPQAPAPTAEPASATPLAPTVPSKDPAVTNTPATGGATAQRLQELKNLLDRKLITPSEYEAKRKAILDAL